LLRSSMTFYVQTPLYLLQRWYLQLFWNVTIYFIDRLEGLSNGSLDTFRAGSS
jgi:fucose 4-O-acetylase-like acetyltransferase